MEIRFEKFLAMTALLAAVGCTTSDAADQDGGAGAGGGTAGAGGTAGSGGTAGTDAGTDSAAGSGGAAGSEAGVCLGDSTLSDAGTEGACTMLDVATVDCSDAGIEGGTPPGAHYCYNISPYLRKGVAEELVACLAKITQAQACEQKPADDCLWAAFNQACPAEADAGVEGGTCATVAAACPPQTGGTAGVTQAQCTTALNAYNDATRPNILSCFKYKIDPDAGTGSGDCAKDFAACYTVPY